jgi:hypothetical protein
VYPFVQATPKGPKQLAVGKGSINPEFKGQKENEGNTHYDGAIVFVNIHIFPCV